MKKIVIFLMLVISCFYRVEAQDNITDTTADTAIIVNRKLVLKAKNTGKKIMLRWAPDSPGAWHLSNAKGYMIERLAYKDDADFLSTGYELLTADTLKPWPLNDWEPIANDASNDKYAAIAAQAIHGKRNLADPSNQNANFLEKANELNNLYAFAMLAAEYSRNAALASALRFEDEDIDPTMNYVYRIYSNAASTYYQIDTAYAMVKGDKIDIDPVPVINEAVEGEKVIVLKWDRSLLEHYSGWYIEKSYDKGSTFKRLNKDPYIHSVGKNKSVDYIMYKDSIDALYQEYQYRIIGINTFAELSEPSKPFTAMGRDRTPPSTPRNINAEQVTQGSLKITWEVAEVAADLKGFYITRTANVGSKEELITPELLSKDTRSFVDNSYVQMTDNWYQVYALDTAGNAIVGYPEYGSVRDDFPPATPSNFKGKIDTTGVVTLKWDLGKEKDLFGYHVYFSNHKDHVYARLTEKPIRDTVFVDTLRLDVLTEEIYYTVRAVDMRRNPSEESKVLKLKKPDVVPPVAPVFNDYHVLKEGIKLSWAPSTSHDIKNHYLYRKEMKMEKWDLIYRTDEIKNQDSYIDNSTQVGKTYKYKLVAEDDDGLQADGVYIITLTAIDFSIPTAVSMLEVYTITENKQAVVKWTYPKKGAFTFILLRAVNGKGFNIVKTLKSGETRYVDNKLNIEDSYEYVIQVQYPENRKSGFSPIKKAIFY